VQAEGDAADDPEDGEEVAEDGDELRQPQRAEGGLREDSPEAGRRKLAGGGDWGTRFNSTC
jgi:hypothetical protein